MNFWKIRLHFTLGKKVAATMFSHYTHEKTFLAVERTSKIHLQNKTGREILLPETKIGLKEKNPNQQPTNT